MADRLPEFWIRYEIQERVESTLLDQITEEGRGGLVSRNSCRHDDAQPAVGLDDGPGSLGEYCIGVDVATTGQRVSAGFAEELAPARCLAQFSLELIR